MSENGISTFKELAQELGVDHTWLSRIVNEREHLTPQMALRMANVLRTKTSYILNLRYDYDV